MWIFANGPSSCRYQSRKKDTEMRKRSASRPWRFVGDGWEEWNGRKSRATAERKRNTQEKETS
jgi:hypothetical protein